MIRTSDSVDKTTAPTQAVLGRTEEHSNYLVFCHVLCMRSVVRSQNVAVSVYCKLPMCPISVQKIDSVFDAGTQQTDRYSDRTVKERIKERNRETDL